MRRKERTVETSTRVALEAGHGTIRLIEQSSFALPPSPLRGYGGQDAAAEDTILRWVNVARLACHPKLARRAKNDRRLIKRSSFALRATEDTILRW